MVLARTGMFLVNNSRSDPGGEGYWNVLRLERWLIVKRTGLRSGPELLVVFAGALASFG